MNRPDLLTKTQPVYYRLFGTQFLRTDHLLASLTTGLTVGAIGVLFDLSFTALIFSGNLTDYLPIGIGVVLFSVAAVRIAMALLSSFPGLVADVGIVETAILGWSVGMIAKAMPNAAPAEILATVLVAIALTSVLTGVFLLALGSLRVGNLVRSLPYPVLGGFIASSGWLLVKGAFKLMTDKPLEFAQFHFLIQPSVLFLWLPGVLLAVYLALISYRRAPAVVITTSLFAAIGLFFAELFVRGSSPAYALEQGWTLGTATTQGLPPAFHLSDLLHVNWGAIASQWMCLGTVIVITAVSLLMNISSLELATDQEVNINRELKITGIANVIAGMMGGITSFHTLGDSILAHRMGGNTRLAGLTGAAIFICVPLFGASLLGYFPKVILGGLLLFLGIELMREWIYDAWFRLSKLEYLLMLSILIVSVTVGFLQGLTMGWILAVILFVITYSRIHKTQPGFSGIDCLSSVPRSSEDYDQLAIRGEQLYILNLQGFLFFGTANSLVRQIQQRLSHPKLPPVRYLLLNFRLVSDVDTSAIQTFSRLQQLVNRHNFTLVFTNLRPTVENKLQQAGYSNEQNSRIQQFDDFDQGLAWCEDCILASSDSDNVSGSDNIIVEK